MLVPKEDRHQHLPNPKVLDESQKNECYDELPQRIIDFMEANHSEIEEIYLTTNSLSLNACTVLSNLLTKCAKLKIIHLDSIFQKRKVEDAKQAMSLIVDALIASKCHLEELNYQCNAFGSQAANSCALIFENPNMLISLKKVYMGDLGLSEMSSKVFADSFAIGFQKLKKLNLIEKCSIELIDLTVNKMRDQGAKYFCDCLKDNVINLKSFAIGASNIGDEGLLSVAQMIITCPLLQTIDIGDNILDIRSAAKFSEAFRKLENLEIIEFSDCAGNGDCMKLIIESLDSTKSGLEVINLSGNIIGKEQLKCISSIISKHKKTLKLLNLTDTELTKDDISKIIHCLDYFPQNLKLLVDYDDILLPDHELINLIVNLDESDVNLYEKFGSLDNFSLQLKFAINSLLESNKFSEYFEKILSNDSLKANSINLITKIFDAFIERAVQENSTSSVYLTDHILRYCGLIKSEFKSYKLDLQKKCMTLLTEYFARNENAASTDFESMFIKLKKKAPLLAREKQK